MAAKKQVMTLPASAAVSEFAPQDSELASDNQAGELSKIALHDNH
jgi:hypothetical protein